ncbi:MAG TPA: Gfo/Idh/MocA family oxidoreductase [Chloroflexota bacterium]
MAERIRYAAVGCGGMGRRHLNGMAALYRSSQPNMELVAVCDLNQENANWLADEAEQLLGARPRVFADIAEMARQMPELQAADVTTDSGSHHAVARACLEAGLHVMCEKPLAVTVRGCNMLIETARRRGRVLSVAENYRRDPVQRLTRALLNDGAIGDVRLVVYQSVGGGDAIQMTPWRHMKYTASMPIDAGVHSADMLRFLFGEVKWVWGETRLHEKVRYKTDSTGPGGMYARWLNTLPDKIEPTGDDALYAQITFQSGVIGSWIHDAAGHGRRFGTKHVFGSKGSLELSNPRSGHPVRLYLDDGTEIGDEKILEHAPSYRLSPLAAELFGGERVWRYGFEFNDVDAKILALEYNELGQCISTGAKPEVTGEEGRNDLALNYGPFEAGRLGRPLTMDELISGRADAYQREIDEKLGLLTPTTV